MGRRSFLEAPYPFHKADYIVTMFDLFVSGDENKFQFFRDFDPSLRLGLG